jgi:hypothetical protein
MRIEPPLTTAAEPILEDLVCRLLCGVSSAWPFSVAVEVQSEFLEYTNRHGVQPLLYVQLRPSPAWESWPSDLRQALQDEAASHAVVDMIKGQETVKVLKALARSGVSPLLMKGLPLAYTHYRSPHLRPRGDTDLLIRRADRETGSGVLIDLGYELINATRGELVSSESSWKKLDRYGVTHAIDLHWRVNNCQIFAEAMSYEELLSGSVEIQALGARALGPVHALLLACMHRVAHITAAWSVNDRQHYGDRLIWLYDIHLLAGRMSTPEMTEFVRLAVERRLKTICLDGLRHSQRCFGTPLPDELLAALSAAGPPEPSAPYLNPGRLRFLVRDIRSLSNVYDRLRLVKEHLFPPAEYMLKKYAGSRRAWLPTLYLRRAVEGIWRLHGER